MDVFTKFIIETDDLEGDCLIMGKCTYHREMATDIDKVKGGGWYDIKENTITFHGDSYQFGAVSIEAIQQAINEDKVFTTPMLIESIATKFEFNYRNQCGEITKLK